MNVEALFHRLLGLGESWAVSECEYAEEANSFYVTDQGNAAAMGEGALPQVQPVGALL